MAHSQRGQQTRLYTEFNNIFTLHFVYCFYLAPILEGNFVRLVVAHCLNCVCFFHLFGVYCVRYAEQLIDSGTVDAAHVETIVKDHTRFLSDELNRAGSYQPDAYYFNKQWKHIKQASDAITTWNTGVDYSILHYVGAQSVTLPSNFVRFTSYFCRSM